MLRKLAVLVCIFVFSFTQIAFSQVTETPFELALPSGNTVELTQQQLGELITKPGIGFANVTPSTALPEDQIAIPLPSELGGGYLLGTPEAIADAMNAVNITVGATADFVAEEGVKTRTILIILAVAGGALALVLGGGGGGAATH